MSTRLALLLVVCLGCEGSYIADPPGDPGDPGGSGGGPDDNGGGGGGGSGGGTSPAPDFSIALDISSVNLALGETKQIAVTVQSVNHFAGAVALSAVGLPPTWQITFSPSANLTVPSDGTASATAIVTIPTDAEAANATVQVSGSAEPGDHASALLVEVRPELVLHIPPNALNNPDQSFGGSVTVRYVAPGTKIVWVNDDTVTHRIHADGSGGLVHEADQMGPGQSYTVTIIAPGTYDYSCHIHPQMTGRLVVSDAL